MIRLALLENSHLPEVCPLRLVLDGYGVEMRL